MPRYPKWVTEPKRETIGVRVDPKPNKETIVSEIRAFADKLEKMLDENDVFSMVIGTENWDYECYSEHDNAIEVNLYYYVPLTEEEIAANKARYEKDAAKRRETYKKNKAKAEKDRRKELERTVKRNAKMVKEILAELDD
jgi:hypothetical protein